MILPIARTQPTRPQQSPAATLDERSGEGEVRLPPGRAKRLDQGHLDLGVTADALSPTRSQLREGVARSPLGYRQERVITHGPLPGHASL